MVLALLVQPLLAALLGAALFPLVDLTGRPLYGGRPADPADAAIGFGLAVGIVAAVIVFFGAFPLLLWLLSRGPVTRRHALLGGLLLGNVPAAVAILVRAFSEATISPGALLDAVYGPMGAVRVVVLGSTIGLTLAAVFYWICGNYLARLASYQRACSPP